MRSQVLAVFAAMSFAVPAFSDEAVAFDRAKFQFSKGPAKVVLSISISGTSFDRTLLTLYGDGRLVRKEISGKDVRSEHERQLESGEVEALLRIAVDGGLAEFDMTRIQDQQLEKLGSFYSVPEDEATFLIQLSLENYQRGDYRMPIVEQAFRYQGASFQNEFYPKIREIEGMVRLVDQALTWTRIEN